MSAKKIALIPGDGIGKEVIPEGKKIMHTIEECTDYSFEFLNIAAGGEVWKKTGQSITDASFEELHSVDAILLGGLGIPELPQGAAEYAVLKIRQEMDQYVNLRPVKLYDSLRDICPLKDEFIDTGIDISIIRENSEGIYRKVDGQMVTPEMIENMVSAIDPMVYSKKGVQRIIEYAFKFARNRGHKTICSVDKANLLNTSKLWRFIFENEGNKYPNLQQESYYVDAFCQWLLRKPYKFETVVTSNMFGDIISDEAAFLAGSLGMGASANINPEPDGISMFEPIHGSAPDIAGQNISNPIAAILSVKLMFEHAFDDSYLGEIIDTAVEKAITEKRTRDIFPIKNNAKLKCVSTQEMGKAIQSEMYQLLKK